MLSESRNYVNLQFQIYREDDLIQVLIHNRFLSINIFVHAHHYVLP